ncbi:MAG: BPTI/Kunitz-type proteinase inhibitor domain-containing protein [bacterium]
MKKYNIIFITIACIIIATCATAAVITLTLNNVPTDLQCATDCLCNRNWIDSDIIMSVTTTTVSDGCMSTGCEWQHRASAFTWDQGILLTPGRLIVELDAINDTITQVEVIIDDYCIQSGGCTSAFLYNGSTQIDAAYSAIEGPVGGNGFFILNPGNNPIDRLVVSSCNGHVGEVRITTTSANVCELPIDPGLCKGYFPRYAFNKTTGQCEQFVYGGCGGNANNFSTIQECQESCGGTTYSTCTSMGCGTTYSTCSGFGCGTTSSTCSGLGCGTTYSTCSGYGCGTTSSTCSGFGCGTTFSTCSGLSCGTTYSTCSGYGCGTTSSTCSGFGCGTTFSTCSGLSCGTTYSTCSGFGCGTTSFTCSGFGCGTTFSTCSGLSCGTTYSTCSGFGCGTTSSTCSGFGCGTTFSTCGGLSCGNTLSTCGIFCGITNSTCSLGCGFFSNWPRYGASGAPSSTPAY